jgi:hypothetical protein
MSRHVPQARESVDADDVFEHLQERDERLALVAEDNIPVEILADCRMVIPVKWEALLRSPTVLVLPRDEAHVLKAHLGLSFCALRLWCRPNRWALEIVDDSPSLCEHEELLHRYHVTLQVQRVHRILGISTRIVRLRHKVRVDRPRQAQVI